MELKLRRLLNTYWILILLICIKFILQYLVINPVYELHRDEFLYLNQADHLAFGYISVPPFTALISKLIYSAGRKHILGSFFPALFGALTIVFTWLIVESLGGSLFSKVLAAAGLTFSLLVRINILWQPNSFDILSWTIIFYFLIRYIQSEKSMWLMLLSVIVALSFYNKYNVIFLIAGLTRRISIYISQKNILLNFHSGKLSYFASYYYLQISIWQVSHQFPVFQHMKVLKANQLDNNTSMQDS